MSTEDLTKRITQTVQSLTNDKITSLYLFCTEETPDGAPGSTLRTMAFSRLGKADVSTLVDHSINLTRSLLTSQMVLK